MCPTIKLIRQTDPAIVCNWHSMYPTTRVARSDKLVSRTGSPSHVTMCTEGFSQNSVVINCWSLWPAKVTSYKHGSSRTSSISCSILSVDSSIGLIASVLRLFCIIISISVPLVSGCNNTWKAGKTSMNDVTSKIPSDKTGVRSRKIQQYWISKRTSYAMDTDLLVAANWSLIICP